MCVCVCVCDFIGIQYMCKCMVCYSYSYLPVMVKFNLQATVEDAILAIFLYEESLTSRFGKYTIHTYLECIVKQVCSMDDNNNIHQNTLLTLQC